MIGITPEQYAQRSKTRYTAKLRVCRKCKLPKEKYQPKSRICTDCLNEQRRRERAKKDGRITMVGKQPKRGRK